MSIPIFERTDKKSGVFDRGYVFTYTEDAQRRQKRCRTLDSAMPNLSRRFRQGLGLCERWTGAKTRC